jgi:hypothetical protein
MAGNPETIQCTSLVPRLIGSQEHMSRTPTCPFFVGFDGSVPPSNASSPVKSVISEPSTNPRARKETEEESGEEEVGLIKPTKKRQSTKKWFTDASIVMTDEDEDEVVPKKTKDKRRKTRQTHFTDPEDVMTADELAPPQKRRKSSRVTSQSSIDESVVTPPQSSGRQSSVVTKTPVSSPPAKSTKPPVAPKQRHASKAETPIEILEEETPAPVEHRRATRSGPAIPPPDDPIVEEYATPEPPPTKSKPKHTRTKSRQVSALSKIVSEVDKSHPRRTSRSAQPIVLPSTPQKEPPIPETEEIEELEPVAPTSKKRGRSVKSRVVDDDVPEVVPESHKPTTRWTRQSVAVPAVDAPAIDEETPVIEEKPAEVVVPKRKRASTRAKRAVSVAMEELPEIEEVETEIVPNVRTRNSTSLAATASFVVPNPEPEIEAVEEEVVIPAPRGRKPPKPRGQTTKSVVPEPTQDILVPIKPGRRGRTASKRDISTVLDGAVDTVSPPAKRKASNLRSIQKIPTPSEDSDDVFEDSKSTFSDAEEPPKKPKRGRGTLRSMSRRGFISEERETEDAPSTIYHSADDYLSSPTHKSALGKSKREMVSTAKKELEEEIWREKVANGEVGLQGSSEDDEKETGAEETGKKPTRTVRGKGAKGRKIKGNGKKGKITVVEISEDDASSVGESHALVVKAMISPLRPGPVLAEPDSDASSEDGRVEVVDQHVTPAPRKVLNWTPAKIDAVVPAPVPNGDMVKEEEEMTVEQWMRYVINDEVNRLEEECEKLVRNLEKEGNRARKLLENLV